jgi:hypothetical protein
MQWTTSTGAVHGDAVHPSRRSMDMRSRFNEMKGYAIFKSPPSNQGQVAGIEWWRSAAAGAMRATFPWAASGVEPTARSGGSLAMRSTPTLSMEDVGSHNDLYRHCQGRTRAGDDEPEGGRVGACVAPPALITLPAAAVAAPLPHRPSGRDRGIARR